MHFQFAFCALHFDFLIGCKLGADPAIRSRSSPDVFAIPALKRAF
jgi:hypothetical protein